MYVYLCIYIYVIYILYMYVYIYMCTSVDVYLLVVAHEFDDSMLILFDVNHLRSTCGSFHWAQGLAVTMAQIDGTEMN